jgi:hypothetical protein
LIHEPREAARPVDRADRRARIRLGEQAQGTRRIERNLQGRDDETEGVRSVSTDDGWPRDCPICPPTPRRSG